MRQTTSGIFWVASVVLLFSSVLHATAIELTAEAAAINEATTEQSEEQAAEARAQKQAAELADDAGAADDEDGRSAYVNNQFVSSEPAQLADVPNDPLYEMLHKQMEQVLSGGGPLDKPTHQRLQQLPNRPIFNNVNTAVEEDYSDEQDQEDELLGYSDAGIATAMVEEDLAPEDGYQQLQLPSTTARPYTERTTLPALLTASSSTTQRTLRPNKRRTTSTTSTTPLPHTTRVRPLYVQHIQQPKQTTKAPTTIVNNSLPAGQLTRPSPHARPMLNDPQVHQQKRRIIFKTISTGSQFVNSPIGDLIIKFSVGFAKPAASTAGGQTQAINEALRALSNNLLKNNETQKQKRGNKAQRD